MTCIVGLIADDALYMAADRQVSNGWDKQISDRPKIFEHGDDMLIGVTGNSRVAQIVECSKPDAAIGGLDPFRYMVKSFIPALMTILEQASALETENGKVEMLGRSDMLVMFGGSMFHVTEDFQVIQSVLKFNALGIGRAYALGAMHASFAMHDHRKRLLQALDIASRYSNGVENPFDVLSIPR